MFTKKPETGAVQAAPTAQPSSPVQNVRSLGPATLSFLGPDLTIVGSLESQGLVQIEGVIEGDVHARQIIVGSKARITGNVVAEEVTVAGEVSGSVRGLKVTLKSGSSVNGDIHHQTLTIDHGAHFEGQSLRPKNVADLAPKLGSRPI